MRTVEAMEAGYIALITAIGTVISAVVASGVTAYSQRLARQREREKSYNERMVAEADEETKHAQAQAELSRTVISLMEPQRKELELQRSEANALRAQYNELDCKFRELERKYRDVVRGARLLAEQIKALGGVPVWEPEEGK